jgi:hypothetical protein
LRSGREIQRATALRDGTHHLEKPKGASRHWECEIGRRTAFGRPAFEDGLLSTLLPPARTEALPAAKESRKEARTQRCFQPPADGVAAHVASGTPTQVVYCTRPRLPFKTKTSKKRLMCEWAVIGRVAGTQRKFSRDPLD